MPVQLPRIGVPEPIAPQSVGREDIQAPNVAQATQPFAEGIQKGTKAFEDAFEKRELEVKKQRLTALDVKSTDESNKFEMWSKEQLAQINLKKGDTTQDYIEYEKQAQQKYQETYSKYETMDSDFKTLLDNKLNSTYQKQGSFRNIQQNEQQYKWRDEVTDNTVKLSQDSMFNSGTRLDASRPETFANMHTYAQDIIQSRIARGSQTGTLVKKEDGTVDYEKGPVGPLIKKDIGDAVIPLVKSLNAAGKVKEGKQVIEQYSPFLNAADRAKLLSDSDEADVSNQAIVTLTKLQQDVAAANPNNPDRRVMLGDIEKLKGLSPAVRFKIIEKNDIFNKRQDAEQDRKREVLVSNEFENLVKRQASRDAYVSEDEWANSPEGKNFMSQNPKPSDINNMRAMVVAPTKSKKSALEAFNQGVIDRSLAKMTPKDISEIYPHLNKGDRQRFDEIRRDQLYDSRNRKAEGPVTGDKISGMHGRMTKSLEQQMKSFRDPKSGDLMFVTNSKDKFTDQYDDQMLSDYNSLVREDILRAGGKLNGAQENEIVNKRLAEMVQKRKDDHKATLSNFFGLDVDYKPTTRETRPMSMRPSTGAYGARSNGPSPSVPAALAPTPSVDTTPVTTSTPVVTPSGVVTNLPPKSDRKSWIRLYEESTGKKFDASKDIGALKKLMNKGK